MIEIGTNAVSDLTEHWPAGLGWTAPDTLHGSDSTVDRLMSLWRASAIKMCEHLLVAIFIATDRKPSEIKAWVHKGGKWSKVLLCDASEDGNAAPCIAVCKSWYGFIMTGGLPGSGLAVGGTPS
jgi:hypothetical protein